VSPTDLIDPFDPALALSAAGLLGAFNRAGVLAASDVHVARRVAALGGVTDELVVLGAAFAVRAPRLGHVCVDLATIQGTASSDIEGDADLEGLPWPAPAAWVAAVARSEMVGEDLPLYAAGSNLYLNRLWLDEVAVATDLATRASADAPLVDEDLLSRGLAQLFGDGADDPDPDRRQLVAAATAVLRRVAVIAGGPGTGKTTTVARLLALLEQQAAERGDPPPLVALAAPTGKAAARLEESVRSEALGMPIDDEVRQRLADLAGTTIHRLLGFDPGNRTRFRHNRMNPLRHDVVVVDETSMVSLSMMARLLEAVGPEARLVLVGDPEQLASIEAGAVLGDVVGPASTSLCLSSEARARLAAVTGQPGFTGPGSRLGPDSDGPTCALGDGVVALRHVHRHKGAIAELARAIQRGDAEHTLAVLGEGRSNVEWITSGAEGFLPGDLGTHLSVVKTAALDSGRAAIEAARRGAAGEALAALGGFRLLCAHRAGPDGVATWTQQIERWLLAEVGEFSLGADWYLGRPLIVTENDPTLGLFNGDIGVVVKGRDRPMEAAFERGGDVIRVSPSRLAAVDTVYAMTVHKSQGSQFATVAFLVPGPSSRILTRELLYTAVTRARERLVLVGTEESIRVALARPVTRASRLRQAFWGPSAHA
jgi:exodeoxyribonuclease V alpha subunit